MILLKPRSLPPYGAVLLWHGTGTGSRLGLCLIPGDWTQHFHPFTAKLPVCNNRNSSLRSTSASSISIAITTMPPRLPSLAAYCRAVPATSSPLISFLSPFLQARNASILATLSDNRGAYNKRIRRGRGPSSGKGKTSGRGHGGQKAHGKVPAKFQGGQTPDYIVKGERGFENL